MCANYACSFLSIHVNISVCVSNRTRLLQYVGKLVTFNVGEKISVNNSNRYWDNMNRTTMSQSDISLFDISFGKLDMQSV